MSSFSGEQFFEALTTGTSLAKLSKPTLTGLVKPITEDIVTILPLPEPPFFFFSPGDSCAFWFPVPVRLIDTVDHLGKVKCGDHQHELVRLHFKLPTDSDALLFAHLLGQEGQSHNLNMEMTTLHANAAAQSMSSFGFHFPTPHLPPIHIPPIHLPDLRAALRKQAEQMARDTAARIDREQGSSTFCPRSEIASGLTALALLLFLTPDPTGGSKIMSGVIAALALTLPNEYCRGR